MSQRSLDNLLWVLLQLVRSAPLGGRYTVRVMTHEERRIQRKYFTHAQLKRAAQIAFERDYNRQLPLDMIDQLSSKDAFPITLQLPHEHANGELVPQHMRCQVVLDAQGQTAFLDVDWDLWHSLDTYDDTTDADVRYITTPSAN